MPRKVREEHDESSDPRSDVVTMEVTINPVQWRKLLNASHGDIGRYLHALAVEYGELRDRTSRWETTNVTSAQGRNITELRADLLDEGPEVSFDDSALADRRVSHSFEVTTAMWREIETAFEQSGEKSLAVFFVHAQQARESKAAVRAMGLRVKPTDQRDTEET